MFTVLKNREFRNLFAGSILTNIGDSLYFIAAMWFVWELTGSTFFTGVAGFLVKAPSAIQFLFGPLVDRLPTRRILVTTQLVQGLCVLVVPLAAVLGYLSVWVVLVVVPILTLMNQIVYPTQRAAIPQLVDSERLVDANSMFTTSIKVVNVGAKAVGGVLISVFGALALYVFDSVTFVLAALLFATVVVRKADDDEDDGGSMSDVTEEYYEQLIAGFEYIRGSSLVPILSVALAVNFGYGVIMAVLPAYADGFGGADVYGLLLSLEAAGAAVGALVASWLDDYPVGQVVPALYGVAALTWTVAIMSGGGILAFTMFFLSAVPVGATGILLESLEQKGVSDEFLGRVGALGASASALILPLGTLVGGSLPAVLPVETIMFVRSVSFGAIAVMFLSVPTLRTLPAVENVTARALNLGDG